MRVGRGQRQRVARQIVNSLEAIQAVNTKHDIPPKQPPKAAFTRSARAAFSVTEPGIRPGRCRTLPPATSRNPCLAQRPPNHSVHWKNLIQGRITRQKLWQRHRPGRNIKVTLGRRVRQRLWQRHLFTVIHGDGGNVLHLGHELKIWRRLGIIHGGRWLGLGHCLRGGLNRFRLR